MIGSIRSFLLKDDGEIPNNQLLPVIVYEGVFEDFSVVEETFNRHNWRGSWSGDIYDFHHYHSNVHEVLGVVSGSAVILLGGNAGEKLQISAGDVVLLPAGTGHKKLKSSADFTVIGAYPNGAVYNMNRRKPQDRIHALKEIKNVPIPELDPVFGEGGPLIDKWKSGA